MREEKEPNTRLRASLSGQSGLAGVNSEGFPSKSSVNENVPSLSEAYFTSCLYLSRVPHKLGSWVHAAFWGAHHCSQRLWPDMRKSPSPGEPWAGTPGDKVLQWVSLRYPARGSLKLLPNWCGPWSLNKDVEFPPPLGKARPPPPFRLAQEVENDHKIPAPLQTLASTGGKQWRLLGHIGPSSAYLT